MLAIASLALAGCHSMDSEDAQALTPSEKELRTRTEQHRMTEAAIAGAVVGVLAGAALGVALGGNNAATTALIGAGAGALAGGLAGAAYGSYVNAKSRQYANTEVRANTLIQEADKDIAKYTAINNAAKTILAEQEAKIAGLNAAYQAKTISKEAFKKEMASSNNNGKIISDQCKAMDEEITSMQQDPQAMQLAGKIEQLTAQRDSLKATYARLLQTYGTVPNDVWTPSS
jgi:uncharacterized protein YcfJ